MKQPFPFFRLLSLLFFFTARMIGAQTEERDPLKALLEFSSENIIENKSFKLIILVNHPRPAELTITPPDFQGEFFLERLRSKVHIMSGRQQRGTQKKNDDESHIWTEIEVLLVPAAQGNFTIGAFSIFSPEETISTLPLQIQVMPGEENIYVPQLAWTGAQNIRLGAEGIISLIIKNHQHGASVPQNMPVSVQTPKNAIVDTVELGAMDSAGGVVLRLRVKPLDENTINFSAFSLPYQNRYLTVPALSIKVLAAPSSAAASQIPAVSEETLDTGTVITMKKDSVPFPEDAGIFDTILARLDGMQLKELKTEVRKQWGNHDYAAALAVLRKGERELINGPKLAQLRQAAEASLGLPLEKNEIWLPSRLFAFIGLAAFAAVVAFTVLYLYRRRQKVLDNHFAIKRTVSAALLCLASLWGWTNSEIRRGKDAVLRAAPAYNVPEISRDNVVFFEEGTPVKIKTGTANWLYAEAPNGVSGWISRKSAVFY